MALQRVQIPSPNYSSSRARNRLLVLHTSEGATTFRSLGNFLANPSSQVSYHAGFDNTSRDAIGEYVQPPRKSWSAHSANNEGEHGCFCVPSGAARGWSRNDWLARPLMLDAAAAWLREESARYGIPLRRITPSQIASGASGVCDHNDCVDAGLGGTHVDVGDGFPWDVVLGAAPPTPQPEELEMWTITHTMGKGESWQCALPSGAKSITGVVFCWANPNDKNDGVNIWGAQYWDNQGAAQGLWDDGKQWELWLGGVNLFGLGIKKGAVALAFKHQGPTNAALGVTLSGT